MLFEAGFPKLREVCDRKGLTYPMIDINGYIDADEKWWKAVQFVP